MVLEGLRPQDRLVWWRLMVDHPNLLADLPHTLHACVYLVLHQEQNPLKKRSWIINCITEVSVIPSKHADL